MALVPILFSISCISYYAALTRGRQNLPNALLLLKNANFTLSNAKCTVASLLPVCLSIFGFSLLLNIQPDVPGDMSWLKMTGWVETVDNEENAHAHTCTQTVCPCACVRSLLLSREAAGRVDLLSFASKNACRSKFKQLWKHMRDLRSVVYLTALNVCYWEKNI